MSLSVAVQQLMTAVQTRSSDLETEINAATSRTDAEGKKLELKQEEILEMQFDIGQYNALLEAASSIAKGTTDMLKTLAQRTS
ncbi:MAG: type III secretion protein [Candidatus Accumulibacter sp.]|jgi:type III secretion protein F|nr:type III secretion protein [Accumulibacter sp.]